MNRRFVFALVASAAFGLLAIWVFRSILQREVQYAKSATPNQIVIAATKIPTGTTITPQHVKLAPYLSQPLPEGAIGNPQDVVGKIAQMDIDAGLPVRTKNIASTKDSRLLTVRPGYRAMSIRVDEATSVSGFATPGSIVDVGAVMTPSANAAPVSKTLVQSLRVLANGQETQARTDGQGRIGSTVTLEVSPAQAGMLALAMREGPLFLTLRHPADDMIENIPPVISKNFVEEYKTDQPRPITTPAPFPSPSGFYGPIPAPTPKTTVADPVPTASPSQKMASIKVYEGTKETTFTVRQ